MSFIEDKHVSAMRMVVDVMRQREIDTPHDDEREFLARIRSELFDAMSLGPNTFRTVISASINAVAVAHGYVYAAGDFFEAARKDVKFLARWDGLSWGPVGEGVDGEIHSLAVDDGKLYAVGNFQNAGNQPANRIACWDGSSWSALGAGLGPSFRQKVISAANGRVFVAGAFDQAGGESVRNLAVWERNCWAEFGGGVNGEVFAILARGDDLFVGGWITEAGGVAVQQVAMWSNGLWNDMAGGVSGGVNPLVSGMILYEQDVYAGGRFEQAGGVNVSNIAKWNGSGWSALGSGVEDFASMAVNRDGVFVTGRFAGRIKTWNGTSFDTLPDYPLEDPAYTVAGDGSDLYVANYSNGFLVSGSPELIAKWSGREWSLMRGF